MDIELLKTRSRIVGDIRRFFDGEGFVEVETPVRIAAPAPEEHIDCPAVLGRTSSEGESAANENLTFLRASPELQMKKLLAAGMDRIYQIGPCFREGEKGSRHNPEFTMIEWYRREATYLDIRRDLERLMSRLQGGSQGAFATLRVRDAYRRFADWDPWQAWDSDRFDFDMATKIEPAIRETGGGVFLTDYPPQAASLAKLSDASPAWAERWEFYFDGIELANCFTELCDGGEQARRFARARQARRALGESDYPVDEEFLRTLPLVGSAAGVALGVDRLVMVLTGAKDISSVRAAE